MTDEYETFIAQVRKTGDSFAITIPAKIAEFGGYGIGDTLRVSTKKVVKNEEKVA